LHAPFPPFLQPDAGNFFKRTPRAKKQQQRGKQQQQRKPGEPVRGGEPGGGPRSGGAAQRSGATSGRSPWRSSGGSMRSVRGLGASPQGGRGWGHVLGGLIPLAAGGHMSCPAPIVKMRAAVAALRPVRELRPQALPIRALAMGGTAIAANLPCGAWREHTRKFSPEWFLAVHATIPFVAMLRKAVLMPKWAILLTVAGASESPPCVAASAACRAVAVACRGLCPSSVPS
jgi:hypothetical protein